MSAGSPAVVLPRTRALRAGLRRYGRATLVLGGLAAALCALAAVAVAVGPAPISPLSVAGMALQWLPLHALRPARVWSETDLTIVTLYRMPRVVTAIFVGGALGAAGTAFQALFRNPLADPGIIGTSAGAGLGAIVAFVLPAQGLWLGFSLVPLAAFAGALGATLAVYLLARVGGRLPGTTLLLAGFAVSTTLNAVSALVETLSDRLREMYVWLLGSLDNNSGEQLLVAAPLLIASLLGLLALASDLNVLTLGDEQAAYLGVRVTRRRLTILLLGALLTSVAVALGGLIALVGLLVPHIMRLLVGANHRLLLPASMLGGSIFLLLVDTIGRVALGGQELPVGLVTALVGAPWFLVLLRRKKGTYAF